MARKRVYSIIFVVLLLTGASSCAFPASTEIPTQPATSSPTQLPVDTATPTIEPTQLPSPSPSDTPVATPITTNLYLPNGVASYPSAGGQVDYYDLQGKLIGNLEAPNLGRGAFQQADIAGPVVYSPGPVLPPLVYYVFENGGELWLNNNNNRSLLKPAPNILNIIGVPGKPILAYNLVDSTDTGLRSQLFIGDLQSLPSGQTVLDTTNSKSYAIKPLSIAMENDLPVGIWYTNVPYGIGGDIVFEPQQTLNYLRLSDYHITTNLDMTKGPAGISEDHAWVAYTPTGGNGPMSIVHNFDFSSAVTFPLRTDSNRGSGDASFSPDNQYVAWREAGGSLASQPPDFHETVRIGKLDGTIITELPDSSLITVSGFSQIGWVLPVGWLDPQTLVLEVRGSSWDTACLVTVKYDGSALTLLAPGTFAGFLYP